MQKGILSIVVAAIVAAVCIVGRPAEAQVMPPVLLKLEQAGKNLKSLQAGITQQKQDRVLGVKENSTGSLLYKAGAAGTERVLLTYTSPIPETVSVIGEKVSIYQPKLNQLFVTSRKAGVNKNRSLGFLGLAYADAAQQLRDRYTITLLGDDMVNGQMATQIQLDPKDTSDGIQGIILWIDHKTWLPVKYFVTEKSSKTTITLTALQPNVTLGEEKFVISVPKDVKVVNG